MGHLWHLRVLSSLSSHKIKYNFIFEWFVRNKKSLEWILSSISLLLDQGFDLFCFIKHIFEKRVETIVFLLKTIVWISDSFCYKKHYLLKWFISHKNKTGLINNTENCVNNTFFDETRIIYNTKIKCYSFFLVINLFN